MISKQIIVQQCCTTTESAARDELSHDPSGKEIQEVKQKPSRHGGAVVDPSSGGSGARGGGVC